MVTAIVLAAGTSSRMNGNNKLLLPYKNKSIIEIIAERLIEASIEEIIIVTGHESEIVLEKMQGKPVRCVNNKSYLKGMTSSIQKGVTIAKGEGYMICLSDMIKLTSKDYCLLHDGFEMRYKDDIECICVPQFKGTQGNPVIFSKFYKPSILNNNFPDGCKPIVIANKDHITVLDMPNDHILYDIDYLSDYEKLAK